MCNESNKCYNSFSCVLSVLPNISKNITEIRTELNIMNEKIDHFKSNVVVPMDTLKKEVAK